MNEIWRVYACSLEPVTASSIDEGPDEDGVYTHYNHYFTSYDKAHRVYEIGEKTMGIRCGLHWHLERIPVDTPWAQEDMDKLAAELTAE